jgi:hypothetical protein
MNDKTAMYNTSDATVTIKATISVEAFKNALEMYSNSELSVSFEMFIGTEIESFKDGSNE